MARNKSRPNGKRNPRTSMRGSMRKLHHAINRNLTVSRLTADPPPVRISREINLVVQALLGTTKQVGAITYSSVGDTIIGSTGGPDSIMAWKLDYSALWGLATQTLGANSQDLRLAVNRVSVWGPLPQTAVASLCIHGDVDDAHCSYVDNGNANSRPRVGFSVPFKHFVTGDSSSEVIAIEMRMGDKGKPGDSLLVGVLQVGITLKRDTGLRA